MAAAAVGLTTLSDLDNRRIRAELSGYADVFAIRYPESSDALCRLGFPGHAAILTAFWWSYFRERSPFRGDRGWAIATLPNTIEEIRQRLEQRARQREFYTYEELEDLVPREDGIGWGAHSRLLGRVLAVISTESTHQNGIMLSAIVIQKQGGGPGEGFLSLARDLGYLVPSDPAEAERFVRAEAERVFSFYSPP